MYYDYHQRYSKPNTFSDIYIVKDAHKLNTVTLVILCIQHGFFYCQCLKETLWRKSGKIEQTIINEGWDRIAELRPYWFKGVKIS